MYTNKRSDFKVNGSLSEFAPACFLFGSLGSCCMQIKVSYKMLCAVSLTCEKGFRPVTRPFGNIIYSLNFVRTGTYFIYDFNLLSGSHVSSNPLASYILSTFLFTFPFNVDLI